MGTRKYGKRKKPGKKSRPKKNRKSSLGTRLAIVAIALTIVGIIISIYPNRSGVKFPKLEVIYVNETIPFQDQRLRYIHILNQQSESETISIQFNIFNFGDEAAKNIMVSVLIPFTGFDFLEAKYLRVADTSLIGCKYKDTEITIPYLRLNRYFSSEVSLPVKSSTAVGNIRLVSKRPLTCTSLSEPEWDYDAILTSVRYDNSLNVGVKRGWLLVVSPEATDGQLSKIANILMERNHALANGDQSRFSNPDLFNY